MKIADKEKQFIFNQKEKGLGTKEITELFNQTFESKRTINSIQHILSRANKTDKTYDNSPFSEELKKQIFSLHKQGLNSKEIGKIVGKTNKAINKFLNKNGLNTSNSIYRILTENEISDIFTRYQNGEVARTILQDYADKIKCENTIISIIRDKGIEIKEPKRYTKIIHEDFFEKIDTEEKAYILGFLITDGYVIYPNRKGRAPFWGITLQMQDKYMLEKIKSIIGVDKQLSDNTNKLHNTEGRKKENRNESVFIVTSLKMVNDLKQYGVVPKKSFTIQFPKNISLNFLNHFIRGVFDGDGGISGKNCYFCGCHLFIEEIQNFLIKELDISKTKITDKYYFIKNGNKNSTSSFKFTSKKDVKAFYEYIYKDATIYLTRKKEKFELLDFINPI